MKQFANERFNRYGTVDLLKKLYSPNQHLYLAVNILESMRVTSVDDAVKDKLEIYQYFVDNKLKYVKTVKLSAVEGVVNSFLLKYCPTAKKAIQDNENISMQEMIEACAPEYPRLATVSKCIFSFFYIVTIMRNIAYPAFTSAFLPYCIDNFRGFDLVPELSDKDEFYLYFEIDMKKTNEIMNVVMGADDVLLCITDENDAIQYGICISDEMCYIYDYNKQNDILTEGDGVSDFFRFEKRIHDLGDFAPMVKESQSLIKECEQQRYMQAVVVLTAGQNIYRTLIDNAPDSEHFYELELSKKMINNRDTEIQKIVCMRSDGILDIPSYDLRKMLYLLHKNNKKAEMILPEENCGYIIRTLEQTSEFGEKVW